MNMRKEVIVVSVYEPEERAYSKEQKKSHWNMAIGLQGVDGLTPSNYLRELANRNIEGELTNKAVEELLYAKYEGEIAEIDQDEKEADMVSARIKELLEEDAFVLSPIALKSIHKYLFKDIYQFAGQYKTENLIKKEAILGGDTVRYSPYYVVEETLAYDFKSEREASYKGLNEDGIITRIVKFTSGIWQIHPFAEGNTRTIAVFTEKYLRSKGFAINNDLFKENALYYRNALVRSNYENIPQGIPANSEFLIRFFQNLIQNKHHILRNRDLILPSVLEEEISRKRNRKENR